MIDIFGRLTACQMMLELEGGFPNVEIMQSCKELFKIYMKLQHQLVTLLDLTEKKWKWKNLWVWKHHQEKLILMLVFM